jgi:hypothetical protein
MKKMYVGFLLVTQIMCASEPSGNTVSLMQNKTLSSNLSWKELYGVRNKNWNKQQGYHNSIATRQTEIASINKDIEAFKSSGKLNKCNDDLAREYARKFDPTYKGSNHFALERYLGLPVQQQWEQARLSQIPGVFTPQGIVQYLNYQISPQVFDNVKQQNIEKIKADQLQLMSELTVKIDKRKILQEEAQGFEKAIVSCDGIAQECSDVLTQKATGIIGSFVYKKMMNYKAARLIEQDRREKVEKEAIELGRRNHAELMQPKINTAIKNKEEQKRLAAELIKAQQAQLALKLAREKEAAEKVQLENERRQAQRIKTQADKDAKIAEDLKKDKEKRKENKQKNKEKKSPIQAEKSKKEIALQAQKAKDAADLKYLTDEAIKIELEQKTAASQVAKNKLSVEATSPISVTTVGMPQMHASIEQHIKQSVAGVITHKQNGISLSAETKNVICQRRINIALSKNLDKEFLVGALRGHDSLYKLFQKRDDERIQQVVYLVKDVFESLSDTNMAVLDDMYAKVEELDLDLRSADVAPLYTHFPKNLCDTIASRYRTLEHECSAYKSVDELMNELQQVEQDTIELKRAAGIAMPLLMIGNILGGKRNQTSEQARVIHETSSKLKNKSNEIHNKIDTHIIKERLKLLLGMITNSHEKA